MGRRGYPAEFRRKVLDLVQAGRSVADVAHDLEVLVYFRPESIQFIHDDDSNSTSAIQEWAYWIS
ncbi:hypothetical protein [Nocardiopsis tropica]|uniref:Transposase n=1 Tax=Nocardiopsis tropica TaxID=109330 RepID=A0ABU7KI51_9ACTN|nr:hypothetical protein [Nocardiopsis umidischolae]MEE2048981.1 hypothetical protein [Nocardiopsis umidischolae]